MVSLRVLHPGGRLCGTFCEIGETQTARAVGTGCGAKMGAQKRPRKAITQELCEIFHKVPFRPRRMRPA